MDSCAADVWALGAILYLLLTDKLPYPSLSEQDSSNPDRFLRTIRLPSLYNISVDAGLEGVMLRCLAADPGDRYRNAVALLADLELWEPGHADARAASEFPKTSKEALPGYTSRDLKKEAVGALRSAFRTAKDPLNLMTAADLLEEAMCKDPGLRERFGVQLELWRKGIMHCPVDTLTKRPGSRRK